MIMFLRKILQSESRKVDWRWESGRSPARVQPGLLTERTAPRTVTSTRASEPRWEAGAPESSSGRRKAGMGW